MIYLSLAAIWISGFIFGFLICACIAGKEVRKP